MVRGQFTNLLLDAGVGRITETPEADELSHDRPDRSSLVDSKRLSPLMISMSSITSSSTSSEPVRCEVGRGLDLLTGQCS